MAAPFLVLDRIVKSFGRKAVIKDATLTAERGETIAIVGPSGSGKTVLLRLIAGILSPDAGDIRLDGQSLRDVPTARRGVGMAFQNFSLYPHLTAFENIASPLRARRQSESEVKRRVGEIAALLRIDHVLDRQPGRLSNGQKQRVALARSLVAGAKLQMLDDPLRNVDAKLRYEMRFELPRLLKTFAATVLYVTQDFREAMAFGDRVAVLDEGTFLQVDKPEAIYRKPHTLQIARLFGDPPINTYRVTPDAEGSVTFFGQKMRIDSAANGNRENNYTLAVRPEHIVAYPEPGADRVAMELNTITPLNHQAVMLLTTQSGEEVLALSREEWIERLPRRHGTVHVAIDADHVLAFDADNIQRPVHPV